MEKIGDASPFVSPGFWGSCAALVTQVDAGVSLVAEFPLNLQFLVETLSQETWSDFLTGTS